MKRSGWIGIGGVGGVAVLTATLVSVQSVLAGSPSCAAVLPAAPAVLPAAPAVPVAAAAPTSGQATLYDLKNGGGNCSYVGPPRDGLYVALPPGEYAKGAKCGGYLQVRGPKGSVRVKIVDQCPECAARHIDLGRTAFARIADPVQGKVAVTYRLLTDPPLPAPLSFRVKEGSSAFWLALLPIDTGNPLASVKVSGPGRAATSLRRTDFGYWEATSGVGSGPFTVRLTDISGHVVTVRGIALRPGAVQTTRVRMYGAGSTKAEQPATTPAKEAKGQKGAKRSRTSVTPAQGAATPLGSATPPESTRDSGGSGERSTGLGAPAPAPDAGPC